MAVLLRKVKIGLPSAKKLRRNMQQNNFALIKFKRACPQRRAFLFQNNP
jgi:hypothetical protein